jgi:nitrate/nitrite transporter NarK
MKGTRLSLKVFALAFRRYWLRIIGTCACWFCECCPFALDQPSAYIAVYDFCSYPFGLFSSTIIGQVNPNNTIIQNIGWGTLINAFYLPGCVVGGILMDRMGRKRTQAFGFALQGVIGMILGGALAKIQTSTGAFTVVYGKLAFFLVLVGSSEPRSSVVLGIFLAAAEAGPGVATILIAGEVFPTAIRGHMLGFAAAWGKAGAAIGTQVFTPIQNAFTDEFKGQQAVFLSELVHLRP